jgi:hypothetical protein
MYCQLLDDGTVTIKHSLRSLWNTFSDDLPTVHAKSSTPEIPDSCATTTNNLIRLPEGVTTTLEFQHRTHISVYRVNVLAQRLDLTCDNSGLLLRNVCVQTVELAKNCAIVYIVSDTDDVTLRFKQIVHRAVCGKLFLDYHGKSHHLYTRQKVPGSARTVDQVGSNFITTRALIQQTYALTSLPLPDLSITEEEIKCSGGMFFDSVDNVVWSLTHGPHKTAIGVDGNYYGLDLPPTSCRVTINLDMKIESSVKKPVLDVYLKYKENPTRYLTHVDVHGKQCIIPNYTAHTVVTFELPKKLFTNAVIYVELKNFDAYEDNFERLKYSIDIR